MNIWKLAAGIAPAIVLFAASADAQLCSNSDTGCPLAGNCGPDGTIRRTPVGLPRFSDEDEVASMLTLSVDQFDEAEFLAFEQGLNPNVTGVTLLGVEVRLYSEISGSAYMHRTDPTPGSCSGSWSAGFVVNLGAEPTLGTPPLLSAVEVGEDSVLLSANTPCPQIPNHEYMKNYANVPGAVLNDADCVCVSTPAIVDNYKGAGTVSWDAAINDLSDSDFADCFGNSCFETEALAVVGVEVVYTYCVFSEECPDGDCDPSGCDCDEPSPHYRKPGSLLLYPEFDNREGDMTLFTITNADCDSLGSDVDVEFVFIDHEDCSEFNATITLTPCDTFTAITNFVNPNMEQGYFYAFAKNSNGVPITHNGLIGSAMVISGIEQFDYQVNPVAFLGMTPEGTNTDLDGDEVRDLDGLEYDHSPDTITVPRFMGQGLDALGNGTPINSHLILIGLSGGQDFTTTLCFDVYNDNEEPFSGEYTFYCWEKPTLLQVRGTFANSFLRTTDHDPDEILGAANRRESGWICIDACFAQSQQETIIQPAFYAVLVERIGVYMAADLPFECGRQSNGSLLARGLFGDGDPIPANGDNQ